MNVVIFAVIWAILLFAIVVFVWGCSKGSRVLEDTEDPGEGVLEVIVDSAFLDSSYLAGAPVMDRKKKVSIVDLLVKEGKWNPEGHYPSIVAALNGVPDALPDNFRFTCGIINGAPDIVVRRQ